MERVILDTKFWIDLRYNPETLATFEKLASRDDIEILFTYGNFIDLAKADEQDKLSEIIASTVDVYLPVIGSEGSEYDITTDPLGLIPDVEVRERARRDTVDFGEEKTLRFIFRISDWADVDVYSDAIKDYKQIYDEFGLDNLKGYVFKDYLHRDSEPYELHEHEINIIEYVRKMVYVHRISLMDAKENVDSSDVADMEICIHAILSDCTALVMEAKWVNVGLIEKVTSNLESDGELDLFKNFETFFDTYA